MPEQIIQASFNSGEWSPQLYARVDISKYRSGAALLENFFVDYRGGASTRPGTKYILQAKDSTNPVRLIPFQASFAVGYVLEFGQNYLRFYFNGAPVLEAAETITSAAAGPPEVFTSAAHGYSNGDWLFIANAYFIVANATTNTYTLTDLFGNALTTNPFTLPTSSQRIYTIASPYAGADLALLKFAQNVNTMIFCHPNYLPYQLVLTTATNWALTPITFGATINAPSAGLTGTTTLGVGTVNYGYVVTSIDINGQESEASTVVHLNLLLNMSTVAGSNEISWTSVTGAVSYNVYKSIVSYFGAVPAGVQYGFIGNVTGTTIIDTNIAADFSVTPPVAENPFFGSGVASVNVTAPGNNYTSVPTVTIAPPGSGVTATGGAFMKVVSDTITTAGSKYIVGDTYLGIGQPGILITVTSIGPGGSVTGATIATLPVYNSGSLPATVTASFVGSSGPGSAIFNIKWGVGSVGILGAGSGYVGAPAVSFSGGGGSGAAATAVVGSASAGNPTVPGYFQQRLVLAAQTQNPQGFNMSRPGIYYNFDVSTISQPDDAISGTLISGQLNTIKAMIPQPAGLLMFTDRNSWIVNGGSQGSAVTPTALVANAQSFNGVSDVPPIVANFDVLYVQSKGSIVRDSAYNIYANVYTGTDISIIASHLFYGFTIKEWAWAEEPFKVVWAVRSDGVMLTLTFLKEQEFIGWAHQITQGSFLSVATVIENTMTAGEVDAIYTVVQRVVAGQTLQYIERIVERTFPSGVQDAWCVDCGIGYSGTPVLTFSGAQFLAGLTVTGIQTDDLGRTSVIPAFAMPSNGTFSLPAPPAPATGWTKVVVGLSFTPKLKTLPLEMGDPTVQGKLKKINSVDVRVADTLGLSIGSGFDTLVPMQDLIVGNVSSMLTGQSSQVVTDLVSGDAQTILDPTYTIPGQYCIQQSNPYPASILGVLPNVTNEPHERRG